MTKWNPKVLKTHRRCSSYPETLERSSLWAKSTTKTAMGIIKSRCEEGQELDVAQVLDEPIPPSEEKKADSKEKPEVENFSNNSSSLLRLSPLKEGAEVAVKTKEQKLESPIVRFDKVKAWSSLPNLLNVSHSEDNSEVSRNSLALTRSNSSRSTKRHGGSQTLPSTPYRSVKKVCITANRSSTVEGKLFVVDNSSAASKLSPSVIHVDYSLFQHTDTPDLPKQSKVAANKKPHSSKQSVVKNLSKHLSKKGKMTKGSNKLPIESNACVKKIDPKPEEKASTLQKCGGFESVANSTPKSKETAIPPKITRSMTCESMVQLKSPPQSSPL